MPFIYILHMNIRWINQLNKFHILNSIITDWCLCRLFICFSILYNNLTIQTHQFHRLIKLSSTLQNRLIKTITYLWSNSFRKERFYYLITQKSLHFYHHTSNLHYMGNNQFSDHIIKIFFANWRYTILY